jgi:hypothetical protein
VRGAGAQQGRAVTPDAMLRITARSVRSSSQSISSSAKARVACQPSATDDLEERSREVET